MNNFIKKNINSIIAIFILMGPVIDLITGISLHIFKMNLTIGIILRVIFMLFIMYTTLFVYKKKKALIPYLIIGIYMVLYTVGIIIYKDYGLFRELQGLIKVFYFPIILISLYMFKDEIKITNKTLFITLFLYLIFIFIPLTFGVGFDSYQITKEGTLGFYNSANEISGIISILTPIMFIVLMESKVIQRIIFIGIYLVVILMMGTKTPLLTLLITVLASIIYFGNKSLKEKNFKKIIITSFILLIGTCGLLLIIPKTNFYKNIETHLDYLELDNVTEVFEDEELIDHFIFSQRLTFLHRKARLYDKSSIYQKLFGLGYLKDTKKTKMIEMDYFDIFYSHGIIGFIVFFGVVGYVLVNILRKREKLTLNRYMLLLSVLLIVFLSFFTGHILIAPAVSILVVAIILKLNYKEKAK